MNGTDPSQPTNRLTCAACGTEFRETERLWRPDVVYRCPVCRLEFVPDRDTHTLTLVPQASSPPDMLNQGSLLNELRNSEFDIDDSAAPPNLIWERVPLEADRAAGEAKPPEWPGKSATSEPQPRKRRPRT